MKIAKVFLLALLATALVIPLVFAAGSAEKGKALFDDEKAFGGQTACNASSCHPDGKGLEKSGMRGKKEWTNPGGKWLNLEDAVNVCIILANKGKAIDPKSAEMKDVVAYIKSLGKKPHKKMMHKKMEKE